MTGATSHRVGSKGVSPTGLPFVERRLRPRGRGVNLRPSIVAAFATMFAVAILTVVAFAYYRNAASVIDLTERFVARVAVSGINRTMALLDPVAANVEASAQLAATDEAQARDGRLFPYMISLLSSTPQLQSIYFAFEADGRFLQAFPIPPGTQRFGANDAPPPPGAQFALRVIDRGAAGYSDVWSYVRRDGTVLGRETSNGLNYDPRPRPWYKDAIAKGGLIWSDLLVYTSNRQPGVTAAYPIVTAGGKVVGVAAANVAVSQLSDFLASLDIGASGLALVVDEREQLIAYPDAAKTVRQDGLKLSLVTATELGVAKIADSFAAYRAAPAELIHLDSGGKRYIASFTGFPNHFGKKWLLAIVVQEDDFVGALKENNRRIVAVGLAMLALGILGVSVMSGWITRPITQLGIEIQKIQRFELTEPIALYAMVSEVAALIHALNMMKRALKTFGMFVPRDLVRELVASGRPIELGGQDRSLTVMFTDIADFTSLSERMAPGDLLVHLSRHLAAVSDCVMEEFGTVDKYIGDAVMAFWGAPTWRDDHALRACVAALRMKLRQAEMNAGWAAEGLPTLYMRVGIHSADVIVGNIGSAQRMSYTVVGDGVNLASRIEGVNKVYGTQICISDQVVAAAGEHILARPLDLVAVKGRKKGEKIYELMAMSAGPDELLAAPAQTELCRQTEAAFAAYQERRWDEAVALYAQVKRLAPADPLADLFIARCRGYQVAPPPADWSGIYEMKSK